MKEFHAAESCGIERLENQTWIKASGADLPNKGYVTTEDTLHPGKLLFTFQGIRFRASGTCFSRPKEIFTEEEEANRKKLFFNVSTSASYVTGRQARGGSEDLSISGVNIGTQTAGAFSPRIGYRGLLGMSLGKTYGIYLSFARAFADQDYQLKFNSLTPLEGTYSGLVKFRHDSFSLGAQAVLSQRRIRPVTHLALGYSILTADADIPNLTKESQRGTGLNIDIGGGVLIQILPHVFIDVQGSFTYFDVPEMTYINSDNPNGVGKTYSVTVDFNQLSAYLGLRLEL
jgi:hypothetical protein